MPADPGMKMTQTQISGKAWGTVFGHGNNVSTAIVGSMTEIVNQPFPSKVHALTAKVIARRAVLKGKG